MRDGRLKPALFALEGDNVTLGVNLTRGNENHAPSLYGGLHGPSQNYPHIHGDAGNPEARDEKQSRNRQKQQYEEAGNKFLKEHFCSRPLIQAFTLKPSIRRAREKGLGYSTTTSTGFVLGIVPTQYSVQVQVPELAGYAASCAKPATCLIAII